MIIAKLRAVTVALSLMSTFLLGASPVRVPHVMIGTWAHGACAVAQNRLVIGPNTATLGDRKPAAIYYDADEGGAHAAIHWSQEYVVDNFVYVEETKAIVHNTQGFGMPGATIYKRCKSKGNS